MNFTPEAPKPKRGILDQYLEKFDEVGSGDFCFGIRAISVDVKGDELIERYLVLQTATWGYETARNPQVMEEIAAELNGTLTPLTQKELKNLAYKLNQRMISPVRNIASLPADLYIQSRKAAFLLAFARHFTSCRLSERCGWSHFLEEVK